MCKKKAKKSRNIFDVEIKCNDPAIWGGKMTSDILDVLESKVVDGEEFYRAWNKLFNKGSIDYNLLKGVPVSGSTLPLRIAFM